MPVTVMISQVTVSGFNPFPNLLTWNISCEMVLEYLHQFERIFHRADFCGDLLSIWSCVTNLLCTDIACFHDNLFSS